MGIDKYETFGAYKDHQPKHRVLFQKGDFFLHSGDRSFWKIECDAFTLDDWLTLAAIGKNLVPKFGSVKGIPYGGLLFGRALNQYATMNLSDPLLMVDDVLTTGSSIERSMSPGDIGLVVFARGKIKNPSIKAIWNFGG